MKHYTGKQIFDAVHEQDDVENIRVSDTGLLSIDTSCGTQQFQMTILQHLEYQSEEESLNDFIKFMETSGVLKEALLETA